MTRKMTSLIVVLALVVGGIGGVIGGLIGASAGQTTTTVGRLPLGFYSKSSSGLVPPTTKGIP